MGRLFKLLSCLSVFISTIVTSITLLNFPKTVEASIWCYSCVSNQPGCSEDHVSWMIHGSITCPKPDDKCIKIIENRQNDVLVTRDCLSNIIAVRADIPGDKYEGCRSTRPNPKIGNHVSYEVQELNSQRPYDNTTYCFCGLDHYCNASYDYYPSVTTFLIVAFSFILTNYRAFIPTNSETL